MCWMIFQSPAEATGRNEQYLDLVNQALEGHEVNFGLVQRRIAEKEEEIRGHERTRQETAAKVERTQASVHVRRRITKKQPPKTTRRRKPGADRIIRPPKVP